MDASDATSEGLPILGSARAGLRLELVLASGALEELDDPFVPLNDSGRFSRVLLGRVAAGDDVTLKPLAVKIQRSSYRPFPAGHAPLTNPQVDELWRRERTHLLQAACPNVVSLLDLGEGRLRSRPVSFCKKARRYFHPPCPTCLALLQDCRDDAVLRDFGLPPYGASASRYLACPSCKPGVFYTYSLTPEEQRKGGATVVRRGELYRRLAAARKGELPADKRAKLEQAWPCAACGHTPEDVERAVVPVSYYEFHMLLLEALPLHYDELVDLLGGAEWADVRRRATELVGTGGREQLLAPLDAGLSSPCQWLFHDDLSGRFAVEALRLKLAAFTQLCRAVREFHASAGQPHLDLTPASAMAVVQPGGPDLPARWNFQVKLIDLASPHRFAAPAGVAGDMMLPAPDTAKTYLSPIVRGAVPGQEESMRVTIRAIRAEGTTAHFELDAVSGQARLREYRARDVVRIVPTSAISWLENAALWGTVTEAGERGFRIAASLPTAPAAVAAVRVPLTFEASVAFTKRYHVPCDVYALGMILFRSVVANDAQDLFAIDEAVGRVLQKLAMSLEGQRATPDARRVAAQLQWQLEAERDAFDRDGVLYGAGDRDAMGNAIPARLWSDVLLFGFRLVSSVAGFSFCAHHADYPAEQPEAVLDRVLGELAVLNARLHVELFGQADRDRAVTEVCEEIMAELMASAGGGSEGEEPGAPK